MTLTHQLKISASVIRRKQTKSDTDIVGRPAANACVFKDELIGNHGAEFYQLDNLQNHKTSPHSRFSVYAPAHCL